MTDDRVDVVSLQPTAIVDKCVVVESAADAIAVLETYVRGQARRRRRRSPTE